jgi:hypothetical protein
MVHHVLQRFLPTLRALARAHPRLHAADRAVGDVLVQNGW